MKLEKLSVIPVPNSQPIPSEVPAHDRLIKLPPHYNLTVQELAEFFRVSPDVIRDYFTEDEPGVIIIKKKKRGTRVYRTIRIPVFVAIRVYRRWGGVL